MYNQSFQRVDYFTYLIGDHKSKKVKKKGINIKGGLNYNLSSSSNVFLMEDFTIVLEILTVFFLIIKMTLILT